MKKTSILLALAALGLAGQALAQQSPWQVRVRAVHLDMANESTPIGGAGASDRVSVDNKTIPEVDVSYFITPHVAAELVLTVPQKAQVNLDGANIGSFRHLPPTLTLQYHFTPQAQWSPYVGAGVNFTRINRVSLANSMTLENRSLGLALQAGLDYRLDKHWSLNLDVKRVQLRSDLFDASGAQLSKLKLDPWLVGVGVGYRF